MADQQDIMRTAPPVPAPEGTISAHQLAIRDIGDGWHEDKGAPAVALLRERERYGIEKYGTVLWEGDERPADQDALDEALDLVVYLRNWINKLHAQGTESSGRRVRTLLPLYRQTLSLLVALAALAEEWQEKDRG